MSNKGIKEIIHSYNQFLEEGAWYGRGVYLLLDEVDPSLSEIQPSAGVHSMLDLIYHMNTWAGFVLDRLEEKNGIDPKIYDETDWRILDPKIHNWAKGLGQFIELHQRILSQLELKSDELLNQPVPFRNYDFRFMFQGLREHDIYHAGQIWLLNQMLKSKWA